MSTRVIQLMRRSAEVAVFLVGIAIGLCAAVLAAAAVAGSSGTTIVFWMVILPFGAIGLIGGAILGSVAADQVWPSENTEIS